MRRIPLQPRDGWQQRVESQGLQYHTSDDGRPYWDERACYAFDDDQVDALETATGELHQMCLAVVQAVVDAHAFARLGIPEPFARLAAESWKRGEADVYGRFDFAYDGHGPPKLLEYNADTPTSLLEAAVIQWRWMEDRFPDADQFNSIHERLIDAWATTLPEDDRASTVYFACVGDNVEDYMTVSYLRDTAMQAGLPTRFIAIEDVGWNPALRQFVDESENPIRTAFKLYPWEWMAGEAFGAHVPHAPTRWIEPAWKMILSNKALLVLLYEMFPDSPYLLPASFEQPAGTSAAYVRKPLLSREGANVLIVSGGRPVSETGGAYGGPYVYQSLRTLPNFDGLYPVVGSWVVAGESCGVGIREDDSPITRNTSRFVPHVILPR